MVEMYQKHGPIFKRRLSGALAESLGEWVVYMVGSEANKFVMQSQRENFSHDKGWTPIIGVQIPKGLLNTDDPEHVRQRKIMNPAFSVAYMNRYLPIMQQVIAQRTQEWPEDGQIDLYEETRKITFDVAAAALIGYEVGPEVDRLRQLFYELVGPDTTSRTTEEWYARIMTVRQNLTVMLLKMIAQRRQTPTDDILGLLVSTKDENGNTFSDEELLGQLNILLIAGHETTTTMSTWALYLLATHPEYVQRIQAELAATLKDKDGEVTLESLKQLKLVGNAIDEAGRLNPPVAFSPRANLQEFEFNGYTVPANTAVRVCLAASHYLPEIFANPLQYDPDRFAPPREEDKKHPYSLVTFGGGPRVCIGMNFAQIEMRALLAHVLSHFTLEAVPGQNATTVYYGIIASLPNGLHVYVKKS
jgi:cytochrome P450